MPIKYDRFILNGQASRVDDNFGGLRKIRRTSLKVHPFPGTFENVPSARPCEPVTTAQPGEHPMQLSFPLSPSRGVIFGPSEGVISDKDL